MSFVFVRVEHKAAVSILTVVRNRMFEGNSRGATGYGVEAVFYLGQKWKSRQLQCETSKLGGRGTPGERHAPARGILGFGFGILVLNMGMAMFDVRDGWMGRGLCLVLGLQLQFQIEFETKSRPRGMWNWNVVSSVRGKRRGKRGVSPRARATRARCY